MAVIAVALSLAGCVDTELGLDAMIQSCDVQVTAAADVTVTIEIDYRVGEHAQGGARGFQPQSIDLYAGGDLVTGVTPSAVGPLPTTLSPGDSASGTLRGSASAVSGAERLCEGEVTAVLRWLDTSSSEIGMAEGSVAVTCE